MMPKERVTSVSAAAALASGTVMAIQARVIGSFGEFTHNGTEFLLISYVMVVILISVIAAMNTRLRAAITSIPSLLRSRRLRWYQCFGGALGAWFAISATLTVPQLGLALSVVCLVSGIFVMGLIVDSLGLGPNGRQRLTLYRVLGAAIAFMAVALEVAPDVATSGMGSRTPVFSLLAFSAGCTVAVQQAFNGRVAAATGHPIAAGWLNYVTCSLALAAVLAVTATLGIHPLEPVSEAPWWAMSAGLLGITWVAIAAWAVGKIGVLRLGLLSVTGQIFAAFLLDLFNPMAGLGMEVRTGTACLIALCAAFVSTRQRRVLSSGSGT